MLNYFKRIWKWLLSFRKSEWAAKDYPLRYRRQSAEPTRIHGEVVYPEPWIVQVPGWWTMCATGSTRQRALESLQQSLDDYREHTGSLPRPGTSVPIKFAPFEFLNRNEEIAREFFPPILGMNYDDCLVTDGSSVWDFPTEVTESELVNKVLIVFGVDISDVTDGNLATILERIAVHRRGA